MNNLLNLQCFLRNHIRGNETESQQMRGKFIGIGDSPGRGSGISLC
jgi:hypothetical protein